MVFWERGWATHLPPENRWNLYGTEAGFSFAPHSGVVGIDMNPELTRYVEQRTHAGLFRELPDAAVTARIITEAVTWFAWHRREDRDADVYDDERARRTVVEFVCGALIEPDR